MLAQEKKKDLCQQAIIHIQQQMAYQLTRGELHLQEIETRQRQLKWLSFYPLIKFALKLNKKTAHLRIFSFCRGIKTRKASLYIVAFIKRWLGGRSRRMMNVFKNITRHFLWKFLLKMKIFKKKKRANTIIDFLKKVKNYRRRHKDEVRLCLFNKL